MDLVTPCVECPDSYGDAVTNTTTFWARKGFDWDVESDSACRERHGLSLISCGTQAKCDTRIRCSGLRTACRFTCDSDSGVNRHLSDGLNPLPASGFKAVHEAGGGGDGWYSLSP